MKPTEKKTQKAPAPVSQATGDAAATSPSSTASEAVAEGGGDVQAPPVTPAAEAEAPKSVPPSGTVKLGQAEASAEFVGIDEALSWLGQEGRDRVEYLAGEPSTSDIVKGMLGPDGRCAPIVFSRPGNPEESPGLLHGYDILAAATVASVQIIPVLFVAPEDVGYVQGFIAQREHTAPRPSDDDELMRLVSAHYDE